MKTNILTKLLFVLLLSFSVQGIFITIAKADDVCTIADDVMDTTTAYTSVRCTMQPEQLRMYPYNLYLCTALPAAPTTTTAIDLTACSQIYSNPDGVGYVDISSVGNPSPPTGGTLIQPPAGVFTHVVLEAKNVMGLQGYFISDGGQTTLTGTHATSPGTAGSGGSCYTVAGSYTNSLLANARCGDVLGDYGMALVTMNCFDDICRSAGTLAENTTASIVDGQWDSTAGYSAIPGNDWQYSPNNGGGTDGATNIPTTDADGVSRTTYFYYTNFETKMLCAGTSVAEDSAGCLATVWDGTTTPVTSYEALDSDITTSMFMVQVLPTAQGNGTLVPTGFNMNFKIATAMIYEARSDYDYDGDNDDDYVAFRMGPLYLDFNLEF